jgi:hypothetical protein
MLFALLFFGIWIADSFFLKFTTQLNDIVPALIMHISLNEVMP